MAGAATLRRLAHVQELEEQQARTALEAEVAALRHLQRLRGAALERERAGRQCSAAGVLRGDRTDWLAGQEEVQMARQLGALLKLRIAEAEEAVAQRRATFLARRVERRQTETLLAEAERRAAGAGARRAQQSADEWFRSRAARSDAGLRPQRGNPEPPTAPNRAAAPDSGTASRS